MRIRRLPSLCLLGGMCFGCAEMLAQSSGGAKYALLIGIDTYQPKGSAIKKPDNAKPAGRFAAGLVFDNLKGPANDIVQMRALLTSAKFGFPDDSQHIHVLMDQAATRAAILDAIDRYVAGARAGDTVVLYISSHGSLRVNDAGDGQVYQLEDEQHKLDNTLVPADAYLGAEDISSRELRDALMKAAKKGVHVTAIIDACHSGGQGRGADSGLVKRSLSWDPRDLNLPPEKGADGSPAKAPEDLAENPVLVLSASQKDQSAMDVQSSTPPHGLFTNALVHALQALPPGAKATDVFRRVMVDMEVDGASAQQPALDGTAQRKAQPLFGGFAENGPVRATVVSVDDSGVVLDIGKIEDIGVGSEFTEVTASAGPGSKTPAMVRIAEYVGVDRSKATVMAPAGAKLRPKEVLERTKWIPAPRPELKLYAGPANLSLAQLMAALSQARASGVVLVKDPSSESDPWTHILYWDGKSWLLQAHGSGDALGKSVRPPVVVLGPSLTAAIVRAKVPAGATLWFDAPLPSELTAMPVLNEEASAARLTTDRNEAMYVAAGVPKEDGLSYAWYERGGFDADVQTPEGFGTGCSPNSAFPLRTTWVKADGADAAATLTESAQRLAKLNGWLTLESTATDSDPFDYSLGLQRVKDKNLATEGAATREDERYSMVLNGSVDYSGPARWVYVLGIDCQGAGQLMWPREGPGGKFPTENGRLATIPLQGMTFRITPPFGTDTYILLTTPTQLGDPTVLDFEGAVKNGTRGVGASALEQLLGSTSSGTRAASVSTPTNWSIQVVQMHSQPKASVSQ